MKNKKFKVVLIALAIILCTTLILILLIAIKNNDATTDITGTDKNTNTTPLTAAVLKDTEYTAKIHPIRYEQSLEALSPTVINSRTELENYQIKKYYNPAIYTEHIEDAKNQYLDMYFSHCTEDFFENKTLILFLSAEGSSSFSHTINGLEIDEKGNLVINYDIIKPESANADILQRLIVIELEKSVGITSATPIRINEIITTPIFSDTYKVEFHQLPTSDNDYTEMYTLIKDYNELPYEASLTNKTKLTDKYSPDFFEEKSLMILDLNGRKENQLKDVKMSVTNKGDLIFSVFSDFKNIEEPLSRWVIIIEIEREKADAVKDYDIDIIYK